MKPVDAFLFAGLAAITFSCGNASEATHTDAAATETVAEQTNHSSHHDTSAPSITLNNGQPWDANPETTEGIVHMAELTGRFVERTDREAFLSLQAAMNKEFQQIVKKCTMKGEAHNQLHNYLMPLKGYIDGLSSESLPKASISLDKLNEHLHDYSDYFVSR